MKVLILRFSSIGDIVLTTPVLRCLKTQLGNIEIHYATKKQYRPLLSSNPYIDKLNLLDEDLSALTNELKKENFDLVIDLHRNLRTAVIKSRLRKKSSSFQKLNVRKWLEVRFKLHVLPKKHIVDRYLDTVSHLGIKNDGKGLDYFIPDEEKIPVSTLPAFCRNGYTAVVIGAIHNTKKLPVEKLCELCLNIKTAVILIGGPEDKENGDQIASADPQKIWNACGLFSLNGSASLLQMAQKVYSHDTGMMHIAAALQKDIVSIWGNTIPEFGMFPYYGDRLTLEEQRSMKKVLEVEHLYCRPCSKIGYDKCPQGHFRCMCMIDLSSAG